MVCVGLPQIFRVWPYGLTWLDGYSGQSSFNALYSVGSQADVPPIAVTAPATKGPGSFSQGYLRQLLLRLLLF